MTDGHVHDLERQWKETGSVDDEAVWLRARVKAGELSWERLHLAAQLGEQASNTALKDGEVRPLSTEPLVMPPGIALAVREGKTLVTLTEEYGYRIWFWLPGMSPEELENWWGAMPTVEPYFMTPEPLPGDVLPVTHAATFKHVEGIRAFHSAHLHEDDDSELRSPSGLTIRHAGWEPVAEPRLYSYVGPHDIRERVSRQPPGRVVSAQGDVLAWVKETRQETGAEGYYLATFVVDAEGEFRIEDYGYEHVACAGGGPVRSAGVAWFDIERESVAVEKISNQSTGFCPEETSWAAVEAALDAAEIPHPGEFTQQIVFRLCTGCGQRNIVKDDWFHCGVCDAELPADWNFDGVPPQPKPKGARLESLAPFDTPPGT